MIPPSIEFVVFVISAVGDVSCSMPYKTVCSAKCSNGEWLGHNVDVQMVCMHHFPMWCLEVLSPMSNKDASQHNNTVGP